ncbi:MAG: hypothetical protein BGP08_18590 [Rhizobiales bacterium 64-17]|nr:MAG: hypothetical protein BGP08_18590 [Rhizobiales bacterium 64-17]
MALWRRTNLRRKLAARREKLVAKYGEVIAEKIIARKVWQGMTSEQLIESWGQPEDLDEKVLKAKTKEIWKYGCNGKNRYRQRVYVENNEVVGWQSQ